MIEVYEKKPERIRAIKWTGKNTKEIIDFFGIERAFFDDEIQIGEFVVLDSYCNVWAYSEQAFNETFTKSKDQEWRPE